MSNILVREYDKTKAGINRSYANFSVVVPGYVYINENPDSSPFDDNGIYECTSQKDFKDFVGLGNRTDEGKSPVFDSTFGWKQVTEDEFNTAKNDYKGRIYIRTAWTDEEIADGLNVNGYLQDTSYKYTKATEWDDDKEYGIIKHSDQCGEDAKPLHFGNQIAYYLLGLGYTVLYKKIETEGIDTSNFWEPLKDKSTYDFRYIITGSYDSKASEYAAKIATFNNNVTDLDATGRGDCVALIDIDFAKYCDEITQSEIINAINNEASEYDWADKYTALFANPVTYAINVEDEFDGNKTFPAYFHYLLCNAKSLEHYAEWYAVSGYTRGISDWKIDHTAKKLGDIAQRTLQPRNADNGVKRAVNLIIKIKNNYYLWGNRTAHALESLTSQNGDLVASHFLNIRQLCTTLKKQLYVTCRRYTFDPNTDTLWFNFCAEIKPLLEKMKADQGIRDYKIFKNTTDKKALLTATIRIVPIEAVEDFEINLFLEDSIDGNLLITTGEE